MIKRLLIISAFTGTAYLSNIFALKYLVGSVPLSSIKTVGVMDSLFNLVINLLAAGLLMTAVRDIAVSEDWRTHFQKAQQARITAGVLLIIPALMGLFDWSYFFLASAPVFALNGDYALYGRGRPVAAAFNAFYRTLIPAILLVVCAVYWKQGLVFTYGASTILMFVISGISISKILKVRYWTRPSVASLKLYIHSINLGIVSFGYYFLGLGLFVITPFFYSESVNALAYVALKFYIIFKGVLRIITQAFFYDMLDEEVCKRVDHIATIAGLTLLVTTTVFTKSFISFFFNENIAASDTWLILIGVCGFLICPLISLTTSAILEKKDKSYARLSLFAIIAASLFCILFSFWQDNITGILSGLILGELTCITGLLVLLTKQPLLAERAVFIIKNLALAILPISIRLIYGDSYYTLWIGAGAYSLLMLLLNHKHLKLKYHGAGIK